MANVQLVHYIVGVTVDDVLVAGIFAFQTATPLSMQIAAGQHAVHVVPAHAPNNSSAIAMIPVELAADGMYTVIANGDALNSDFKMLSNTRSESVADGKVEFRIVHCAGSLGEVDLRSLTETGRWANNLSINEATGYRRFNAALHNVKLLDGQAQIDVATDSCVFFPQVVKSAEAEELPTESALQGNYPNQFNPSTQIQFDLPLTADVEIQGIDLSDRMVLSLYSKSVEAAADRPVELDGSSPGLPYSSIQTDCQDGLTHSGLDGPNSSDQVTRLSCSRVLAMRPRCYCDNGVLDVYRGSKRFDNYGSLYKLVQTLIITLFDQTPNTRSRVLMPIYQGPTILARPFIAISMVSSQSRLRPSSRGFLKSAAWRNGEQIPSNSKSRIKLTNPVSLGPHLLIEPMAWRQRVKRQIGEVQRWV